MRNLSLIRNTIVTMAILLGAMHPAETFAHFLFIRIGEQAEAGRAAEVFFSERAAAGDPRFIGKVAGTQLWMQQEPGTFVPLKTQLGTDRLRALLPIDGAVSVNGICEYGILEREVPFLLRYYPKAIVGSVDAVNQLKPSKSALEIIATVNADSITLTLLDNGKPVPNTLFTTVDDDLVNEELKADGEGHVTWKPTGKGHFCVYTKVIRKQAGELNGKKYTEIREFPTLSFQWPLGRTDGDQAAVELFQQAIDSRAIWHRFPGFTAKIEGEYDGRPFSGTIDIDKAAVVELKIDQEVAVPWVEQQLKSLVNHRTESAQSDKPVLRFADQDVNNPLGRLLIYVGGQFASSFRVKDGQLKTVNRKIGSENMTITILENQRIEEGKFLPRFYNVQYWNVADGQLSRTETIENRWDRVGSFDLPSVNSVITSSSAGISVRSFRLTNQELRNAE